jgi:hypothetical protein
MRSTSARYSAGISDAMDDDDGPGKVSDDDYEMEESEWVSRDNQDANTYATVLSGRTVIGLRI